MTRPAALVQPLPLVTVQGDAELVQRARAGEDFAFDALYRRHVQFVAAVAFRVGRNRGDVDDVVQETFVIAFRQLDQLSDAASLRGWLARIAVSRVARRNRFKRILRLFRDEADEEASLQSMVATDASPVVRAQLTQIDAVVGRLPSAERTAWVLRFVLGCTLEEVAEGSACSLATAKRRLASAVSAVDAVVAVELDS